MQDIECSTYFNWKINRSKCSIALYALKELHQVVTAPLADEVLKIVPLDGVVAADPTMLLQVVFLQKVVRRYVVLNEHKQAEAKIMLHNLEEDHRDLI